VEFFKQRKNKRFSYTPKHLRNQDDTTKKSVEAQWEEVRAANKRKKSIFTTLPFLVLFLIGVLVILYILSRYE